MKTIKLGDMQIDRIIEMEKWSFIASDLFPSLTPDLLKAGRTWLDERFIDPDRDSLILGVHSFLVRSKNHTILIDTCNGNHRNRPSLPSRHQLNTPYLANLANAGVGLEDIDIVICTHLHPDHCGWNTCLANGQWLPTFPRAKYLINSGEFERAAKIYAARQQQLFENDMVAMFEDSVLPLVRSKQLSLIDADHIVLSERNNEIWLESSVGHTSHHASVHLKSQNYHAIITGDVIHHPIQLDALDLANASDFDPILAAQTRKRLIASYTDTNTIILTGHFAGLTAGRFVTRNGQFRFEWLGE